MKIAIVGAGAMGSLFGALLSEAGNEVWLYDVWHEHVDAINRNGLQVERDGRLRCTDGSVGGSAENRANRLKWSRRTWSFAFLS